jgi:hypothetical protein
MKLINEELYLDELDLVEANDLNHNLFGPLTGVTCEVWRLLDGRVILSGIGYGADRWGGDHAMEFEIIIDHDEFLRLTK